MSNSIDGQIPSVQVEEGLPSPSEAQANRKGRFRIVATNSVAAAARFITSPQFVQPAKLLGVSMLATAVVVMIWWFATADQRITVEQAAQGKYGALSQPVQPNLNATQPIQ